MISHIYCDKVVYSELPVSWLWWREQRWEQWNSWGSTDDPAEEELIKTKKKMLFKKYLIVNWSVKTTLLNLKRQTTGCSARPEMARRPEVWDVYNPFICTVVFYSFYRKKLMWGIYYKKKNVWKRSFFWHWKVSSLRQLLCYIIWYMKMWSYRWYCVSPGSQPAVAWNAALQWIRLQKTKTHVQNVQIKDCSSQGLLGR